MSITFLVIFSLVSVAPAGREQCKKDAKNKYTGGLSDELTFGLDKLISNLRMDGLAYMREKPEHASDEALHDFLPNRLEEIIRDWKTVKEEAVKENEYEQTSGLGQLLDDIRQSAVKDKPENARAFVEEFVKAWDPDPTLHEAAGTSVPVKPHKHKAKGQDTGALLDVDGTSTPSPDDAPALVNEDLNKNEDLAPGHQHHASSAGYHRDPDDLLEDEEEDMEDHDNRSFMGIRTTAWSTGGGKCPSCSSQCKNGITVKCTCTKTGVGCTGPPDTDNCQYSCR